MYKKKIQENIYWLGAVDWDRRLFDSLIPLPDGTSYNAYLIEGSEKTVLLDAVDLEMSSKLMAQLADTQKIDFIICHHVEQDHSGAIPLVLKKFPEAKIIASPKAKPMLIEHLHIAEELIICVEDGETLSLGDKTLNFIHTPWVHWPETMSTYLKEDKILFSCDFFGSHIAASEAFVIEKERVYEAAKRYFAEIMMPFRNMVKKNLEKLQPYDIKMIAPGHGQIYDEPEWIIEAYKQWANGQPRNLVVLPFVSMHGSTALMVNHLTAALSELGVEVELFNLTVTDIGKLAMSLIDAGTIVIGTPTVLVGPHPLATSCAILANALKPKIGFLSIIGSYGWGGKSVETLVGLIPNLKAEILEPVLCKGLPREKDLAALDKLAEQIAKKHKENGFI